MSLLDGHRRYGGQPSVRDVVETILGVEIVDESDPVPDLREFATRIRDERLRRNRQRWAERTASRAGARPDSRPPSP